MPLPAEPGPQRLDRVGDGEAPNQVLGSYIHYFIHLSLQVDLETLHTALYAEHFISVFLNTERGLTFNVKLKF